MAFVPSGFGVLQIEPTDHCNLACRMCAPHADRWDTVHGIPKGYMSIPVFEQVLENLGSARFDHVILQWLGDPSLHPQLEELVRRAGERLGGQVGYLRFDTNAILLPEARIDRLLEQRVQSVPLKVVVTLDAVSPATYRRVKGRDGLHRARRHARHLLAHRPRGGGVDLQLQFVVQAGNAHEAGEFLRYWRDAARCHGVGRGHVEVCFKRLSVSGGAAGQAAADALYERTLREAGIQAVEEPGFSVTTWSERPWQRDDAHSQRDACPGLWFTPVVRHDGALLMCCADLGGELALGSLASASFASLWEGPQATAMRMAHLEGRYSGVCASCGGVNWYSLTGEHREAARRRHASFAASEAPSGL